MNLGGALNSQAAATCQATNDANLQDPRYKPPFYGIPSSLWFTPGPPANGAAGFLPPYGPSTCGGYQFQQRDQDDVSFELRFTSPGDQAVRWLGGVYVADIGRDVKLSQGADLNGRLLAKSFVPSGGPNPTDLLYDDTFVSQVFAVFGQVSWDVTDALEVALALRYDTEDRYSNVGVQGIKQNDRPLPGWLLDLLIGMYLFTADDVVLWSSDMNFIPGPLGGNYTNAWRYNAHGVLESVVNAAHRYSALDPLHASDGRYQWCWFNLAVVKKKDTPGERYFEKSIAMGKLRRFEGYTWLELLVAWPALDQTPRTFKVWLDKDGQRSNAYTIQLAHGRTYFYDAWQLPDSFTGLEGQHVWLRATDLLGVQRTWRGDWRQTADNRTPTPPDVP